MTLNNKLISKDENLSIIRLGYVCGPIAVAFAYKEFTVIDL